MACFRGKKSFEKECYNVLNEKPIAFIGHFPKVLIAYHLAYHPQIKYFKANAGSYSLHTEVCRRSQFYWTAVTELILGLSRFLDFSYEKMQADKLSTVYEFVNCR